MKSRRCEPVHSQSASRLMRMVNAHWFDITQYVGNVWPMMGVCHQLKNVIQQLVIARHRALWNKVFAGVPSYRQECMMRLALYDATAWKMCPFWQRYGQIEPTKRRFGFRGPMHHSECCSKNGACSVAGLLMRFFSKLRGISCRLEHKCLQRAFEIDKSYVHMLDDVQRLIRFLYDAWGQRIVLLAVERHSPEEENMLLLTFIERQRQYHCILDHPFDIDMGGGWANLEYYGPLAFAVKQGPKAAADPQESCMHRILQRLFPSWSPVDDQERTCPDLKSSDDEAHQRDCERCALMEDPEYPVDDTTINWASGINVSGSRMSFPWPRRRANSSNAVRTCPADVCAVRTMHMHRHNLADNDNG